MTAHSTTSTVGTMGVSVHIQSSPSTSSSNGYLHLGTVTAIGALVKGVAINDRVAVHISTATSQSCGHCRWCLKGQENLCSTPLNGPIVAQEGVSGSTLPAKSVFKIPHTISSADALAAAASVYAPLRKHMVLGARVGIMTLADTPVADVQQRLAHTFASTLGAGHVSTNSLGAGSVDLLLVLLGSSTVPEHVPWEDVIGQVDVGGKVVLVAAQTQKDGQDHDGQMGIKVNLGALISGQRQVVGSTWNVPRGEVEDMVRFASKMDVEL